MYGYHIQQSLDQSGKVTNPACGQLHRETDNLVSRDVFGHPILRQPAHPLHPDGICCLFTGFPLISAVVFLYLYLYR